MNRMPLARMRGAVVALLAGAVLCGCSYVALPRSVPLVKGMDSLSLASASVIVTNAEKDSSAYPILTDEGGRSGFEADRQAWSRQLVFALAGELARRGVQVRSDAALTLGLSVPQITYGEDGRNYHFTVTVLVSSSTGWSKQYRGAASAGRYGLGSADHMAGQALSEAVKAMLGDAEFISQLSRKP